MLQRVMPDLMGMKNILVLNDEAHHCYREKPGEDEEGDLKGDDRKEAEKNNEAARLWISGIEAVNRKLGIERVYDLSATPFFLRGSGYAEGTLFPWTMSDFSLMDAIECGIVKLPRVPVADNIPGATCPSSATCGSTSARRCPRRAAARRGTLDPLAIPVELQTALEALYGHYEKTYELWQEEKHRGPAVLHRRLQQHVHVQADLRLHLRLLFERTKTARAGSSRMAASSCSATSTNTATPRPPARCLSTASSSNPATRSTRTSAIWPPTRSNASAVRSSSAPATERPRTSPTRTCCARS
jgi:hypothetical protein